MAKPQIVIICNNDVCKKEFTVPYKGRNRKFCSLSCASSGPNNAAYGRTYRTKETHPEWASTISKTSIERAINSGDTNGMKNPEVRARQSKSRRDRVTSDPDYRRHCSENTRQAWADGKYDGVKVGRCKWYDHVKPNGDVVKLQGTWEVKYAKYLDVNNVEYECHSGRIPYVDNEGVSRSYYPDFRIITTDEYVDVKNPLYVTLHAEKFDCIRRSNPEIKLRIVERAEMRGLGIDV